MKKILILTIITFLPLIAQEFLKGVKTEDLMLDRIEAPSAEDTIGISDWSKFFFNTENSVISSESNLLVKVRNDGIWSTNLRTGEVKQIDNRGVMPKWSPTSNLFAFLKQRIRTGEYYRGHQLYGGYELWLYYLEEDKKLKITDSIAIDEFIWSSDGKYIVFTYDSLVIKKKSPLFLGVLNILTKEVIVIDSGSPYTNMSFSISPDGQMIAYCKPLKWKLTTEWWVTDAELFIVNIDGSGKIQITKTDAVETMVKWLNDGKSLIVEQFGSDPNDISSHRIVKIILKKKSGE